ncbi:hypothetical protein [Rhizobacter sp. Root404]|uniref:hypothetical protein n=1 Tax=Rhizobacter sp. Root404 TaxID=1736528 RepID=UPI0006F6E196|nr:hypothetical protein [Rhizobacter sp. Root404]KQW38540.1 hypothetical protein ASC76_11065 [Rhizobacter sp. Root404]
MHAVRQQFDLPTWRCRPITDFDRIELVAVEPSFNVEAKAGSPVTSSSGTSCYPNFPVSVALAMMVASAKTRAAPPSTATAGHFQADRKDKPPVQAADE